MKTFPIRLRQNAKYFFRGQEDSAQHRSHGTIIGDASLENSAFYIANGMADLWTGSTSGAEFLDPRHPQSRHQRYLKRRAEEQFLIQCGLNALNQPPNP